MFAELLIRRAGDTSGAGSHPAGVLVEATIDGLVALCQQVTLKAP